MGTATIRCTRRVRVQEASLHLVRREAPAAKASLFDPTGDGFLAHLLRWAGAICLGVLGWLGLALLGAWVR